MGDAAIQQDILKEDRKSVEQQWEKQFSLLRHTFFQSPSSHEFCDVTSFNFSL